MNRRYFITLAYLGRDYHGWQFQPNANSVQECIEKALQTLVRQPVSIVGAGRTDAGVNASMMVAHVDLPQDVEPDARFVRRLNSILGETITIQSVRQVHPDAHARFDATGRTYHYYVHKGRNPFASGLSWRAPENLDFNKMNQAAEILLDTTDFTSFSKLHTDVKTNNCRVSNARWKRVENPYAPRVEQWVFEITADRFLRNMVRAVVGTLIDVGRGKLSVEGFRRIIEARNRCAAGTSMPGGALFLHEIEYPYEF